MKDFLNSWSPQVLSLLRIVVSLLFMQHGGQKLFGFPAPQNASFELFSLYGMAGILEFFGGALLLIGLFTRPIAFLLCGEMAFAYFLSHFPKGFWPIVNRGELAVLFCFIFLYFVFSGGGPWEIDRLINKRK